VTRIEPILSPEEVRVFLEGSKRRGTRGIGTAAEPVDLLADDRAIRLLIPPLQIGFARLAESLRRVLTSVLRTKVEIKAEAPEILTGRGLQAVGDQAACLMVLELTTAGQERQYGIIALDPQFAFSVIERLFGGSSGAPEMPRGRSPTALERRMLVRAMQPVVDAMNTTLEPPGFFHCEVHRIEARIELIPGYSPDITALHVPFTLTIGDRLASLSIGLPAAALEPLRGRMGGAPKSDANSVAAMSEAMRDVDVVVSVELGSLRLPLRRVLALEPGQVLTLDRNRSDELPVRVEGKTKFRGVPVQDEGAIAIEIKQLSPRGA